MHTKEIGEMTEMSVYPAHLILLDMIILILLGKVPKCAVSLASFLLPCEVQIFEEIRGQTLYVLRTMQNAFLISFLFARITFSISHLRFHGCGYEIHCLMIFGDM